MKHKYANRSFRTLLTMLALALQICVTASVIAQDATQLFAQGVELFNAGNIDEAIEVFRRIVANEPDFADAHYHLGLSYYRKAKFDRAIAAFQQTLKRLPRDADARVKLGMAYYKKGEASRAVEEYENALEIQPNNVEALNNLGMAYDELGGFNEAITVYQSALKISPEHAQLQVNLSVAQDLKAGKYSLKAYRGYRRGRDFVAGGKIDTAIAEWKKAIADSPNYTQAHLSLAEVYFNQRRYSAAIEFYTKAGQLDLDNPQIFYNLGNAYQRLAQLDQAVVAYQRALQIDPAFVHAYANMGNAFFEMERFDDAIAAYQDALQKDPNLVIVQSSIRTVQEVKAGKYSMEAYRLWKSGLDSLNTGDIETAVQRWKEATRTSPRYAQAHESLGWAYFNLGQYDESIREYQTALQIRPSPEAQQYLEGARDMKSGKYTLKAYRLWERGRQLSMAGKLDEAIEALKQSIQESPNFAESHNTLAWIYADKFDSNLDEAEILARKAIKLKPNAAHIYDTLGWTLYKQGRYAESTTAIEQAIALDATNGEYWYHASVAYMKNRQKTETLEKLSRAIALDGRFRELAQKEKAFAPIRFTQAFQKISMKKGE